MRKIQSNNPLSIKRIMLLLFLFLLQSLSYGQNKIIDSLLISLNAQTTKVQEVDTYNELAWEYKDIDISKGLDYAYKAKQLSDSLNYTEGYLTSRNRIGVLFIQDRRFGEAKELYEEILKSEIARKDTFGIARSENQLSIIYRELGDYNQAIIHAENSLPYFESLEDSKSVATVTNNLGIAYKYIGDYKKAQEAYIKSFAIREQRKDSLGMADSHLDLGNFYYFIGNNELALDHLAKSEALLVILEKDLQLSKVHSAFGTVYENKNELDKALDYYQKSLSLKQKVEIQENQDVLYNNLGIVSEKKNELDQALRYYQKSLAIKEQNGLNTSAEVYNNIANVFNHKKEYNNALDYYEKSLEEAIKSNNITLRLKVIGNISKAYTALERYDKSVLYYNQYNTLRDSIDTSYKNALEFRVLYDKAIKRSELLKKDNEIIKKNNEINQANLAQAEAQNNQKSTFITALSAGIFLLGLLFYYSRRVVTQKQNIDELLKDQEIKSINTMIATQDSERKRIARELHDNLGGKLSVVKIHFKTVEDHLEELAVDDVSNYQLANNLLDDACEEIRKIAYDMSSGELSNFGLVKAIQDLIISIEKSNQIDIEFVDHNLEDRLDSKIELHIYRIVQELISNVLKHAKASELTIQILKNNEGLNLMAIDNGIGFNMQRVKKGMGIQNIKTRVEELHGELEIDSGKGNGTTITIQIPIDE